MSKWIKYWDGQGYNDQWEVYPGVYYKHIEMMGEITYYKIIRKFIHIEKTGWFRKNRKTPMIEFIYKGEGDNKITRSCVNEYHNYFEYFVEIPTLLGLIQLGE